MTVIHISFSKNLLEPFLGNLLSNFQSLLNCTQACRPLRRLQPLREEVRGGAVPQRPRRRRRVDSAHRAVAGGAAGRGNEGARVPGIEQAGRQFNRKKLAGVSV